MHNPIIKQLKGIIFDLDGTLANTHLDFPQMCIDAGVPVGTRLLEHCASLTDKSRSAEILSIVEQHEIDGASRAEWILDAEQILSQLKDLKIPMAIVTRNMRVAAKYTIQKLSIPIDFVITRQDCQPKPDPEGLLMVARHWDISPENLVYVGDYKFDIEAAKNAGMMAILLANHRNQAFHSIADKVIHNFKELTVIFDL